MDKHLLGNQPDMVLVDKEQTIAVAIDDVNYKKTCLRELRCIIGL